MNKDLTATGIWHRDHYNVNMCGIYTELIKQAAKCKCFSSDILYDVREIDEFLSEEKDMKVTKLFGFRDYGVDSNAYVKCRYDTNTLEEVYRVMYKLKIEIKKGSIYLELIKCPSKKSMKKFVKEAL